MINQNDLETKIRAGRKFLAEGNKLKVTLKYRSFRMLNLDGPNQSVLDKYYECISDMAILEQRPILEGKNMTMILVPKKEIKKNKECN